MICCTLKRGGVTGPDAGDFVQYGATPILFCRHLKFGAVQSTETTGLVSLPIRSISTVTTSPFRRKI